MRTALFLIRRPCRVVFFAVVIPVGLVGFFARILLGDLYYQSAMALKQQVHLDSAAASLEHAIFWQPGNAAYYRELGRIHMAMSSWRPDRQRWIGLGISDYRRSIELNPHDSRTLFDLGMAYTAAGEAAEAHAAFLSGLKLDPNNPAFYVALGGIYESQGRPNEARDAFKRAYDLSPYDRETIRNHLRTIDQAASTTPR